MGATEERIALISSPFRYAVNHDQAVKTVVPTADSQEVPGYFDLAADASALNATVFALRSDPRSQFYSIVFEGALTVDFNGVTPHVRGDDIAGLVAGRTYIVVGAETDGETTTLTVWG